MNRLFFAAELSLLCACGDPSYVYQAKLYDEARDCLHRTEAVDVVSGDFAQCKGVCLAEPPFEDAGRRIWIATMCEPYPYPWDASGNDPACAPAFAAAVRRTTCLDDGGVSSSSQ